jgi:hypothetical protein
LKLGTGFFFRAAIVVDAVAGKLVLEAVLYRTWGEFGVNTVSRDQFHFQETNLDRESKSWRF